MALKCVCIPVNVPRLVDDQARVCVKSGKDGSLKTRENIQKPLTETDICNILKRTQDEQNKHNDYECHTKGENRQNLINKLKMFLDDYDDRPVMKRSKGGPEASRALGQTGFGPLIRYPGYVDYEHPYFSDPFNKMPTLATTVGQHGKNPCPPISVRNWDETQGQGTGTVDSILGGRGRGHSSPRVDERCHCAERRGEPPKCPAASTRRHQDQPQPQPQRSGGVQAAPPGGARQYYCYPLPDDC